MSAMGFGSVAETTENPRRAGGHRASTTKCMAYGTTRTGWSAKRI